MTDDSTQYIARISYGKDSLKMLDVIHSRGLPLDRITTTEVWATDTISVNLPPMQAFKERMDQWIWERYRVEVEHLCALNPDGTKRTYEQMFYHVPKRRSQDVQVEREREREKRYGPGSIFGWPTKWCKWCQDLKRKHQGLPIDLTLQVVSEAQATESRDSLRQSLPGAESSRSTRCGPLFTGAGHDSPEERKDRGIYWHRGRRAEAAWAAQRAEKSTAGRIRHRRGAVWAVLPV